MQRGKKTPAKSKRGKRASSQRAESNAVIAAKRSKIVKHAHWFENDGTTCGLKPVFAHPDLAPYTHVAELGTFTPKALPGATVVDHDTVKALVSSGAVLVDTRIESEYRDKHIPGALWLPMARRA